MNDRTIRQSEPMNDPDLQEVDRRVAESMRSEIVPDGLTERLYQGSVAHLGSGRADRRLKFASHRWTGRSWSIAALMLLAVTVSIVMLVMNRWSGQNGGLDQVADGTGSSGVSGLPNDFTTSDDEWERSDTLYQDTLALDLSLLEDRIERVGLELAGLDSGYSDRGYDDWSWETSAGLGSTGSLDQTAASILTRIDSF